MSVHHPPQHTQVLVIGGGPAGSTAAAALVREGFHVVLLEMAQFPRYHIGESLIPSVRHYLRYIGAENKVLNHGFVRKPGSAIKFNQYMQEGYTDFVALGESNAVWNVKRSEFDHLLLNHAEECGAEVFQSCRVLSLQFDDDNCTGDAPDPPNSEKFAAAEPGRPISATYMTAAGVKGDIAFDYLVDASGRAGVMSTKYLKNRHYNASLKNVAVWGYWRGTGMYGRGTHKENAPFFEALSDESGWAWFIPLANGLTSVGVVMEQKQVGMRSRACSTATNSTQGSSTPLNPWPRPTPLSAGLPTPKSGLRPRARSSTSGPFYRGTPPSPSPPPHLSATVRSRACSASLPGSAFVLPTTHELEKEIEKDREVDAEKDTFRMPGEFPAPLSSSVPYPSPPLTPLTTTFSGSASTPTSPTMTRPLMHLRSQSVTGEEIPARKASALAERYLSFLQLAPGVMELIGDEGVLVKVGEDGKEAEDGEEERTDGTEVPTARTASDYSYSASKYAGPGYRIIGDAGAFIDPFFSSGVHLAMTGALSAAASVCASVRGDCTEAEAAEWCSRRIAISYTRFLVVVLSAYKQIRSQSTKVLADIDDDNFDKAFMFLRPVIQGSGEMGAKISEDEVQRALDFCMKLFNPTTPEQHDAVRETLSRMRFSDSDEKSNEDDQSSVIGGMASWMDVRAPIVSSSNLANMLRTRLRSFSASSSSSSASSSASLPPPPDALPSTLDCVTEEHPGGPEPEYEVEDAEMKMVLEKVNARRVIHVDHMEGLNSLEQEDVRGFVVRLVRGQLGLVRT